MTGADARVGEPDEDRPEPHGRAAVGAFVVAVAVAVVLIRHLNREQWFNGDEWELLLRRSLDDPAGLLARQGDHFTALPAVAYRVLFRAVGLHHYWPYQGLAIAVHVGVVVLLRAVMVRARVDPWVATLLATVMLLFGSGRVNIAFGFQITLTGAVLLGLVMLLLADRDGPLGPRDAAAALVGVGAVACSGAAVPMLAAAGLALVVRRGAVAALVVVGPPVALFGAWSVLAPAVDSSPRAGPGETLRFAGSLLLHTVEALGGSTVTGLLLVAAGLAGAVVATRAVPGDEARSRWAATGGLLAGGLVCALVLGYTRGAPGPWARDSDQGRYLYLVALLVLPALGVGLTALLERWRPAGLVGLMLVVVGLPANVAALDASGEPGLGNRPTVLHLADLSEELDPPPELRPILWEGSGPGLRMGPLQHARQSGRVPDPPPGTDDRRERARLVLLLAPVGDTSTDGCRPLAPDRPVELDAGDRLVLTGRVEVRRVVDGRPSDTAYSPLSLTPVQAVEVTHGPVVLMLDPAAPDAGARSCR